LQDEIAMKVLSSFRQGVLGLKAYQPNTLQKYFKGKQGIDCYLKQLQGSALTGQWNVEDNERGRKLIEEAITNCPDAPSLYLGLGWYYHHLFYFNTDKRIRQEAIEKCLELADKAIEMDETISEPHVLKCSCYTLAGEYDKGMSECERAIRLNPNSYDAKTEIGATLMILGRYREAISYFQEALRLNPRGRTALFRAYGWSLLLDGQVDESIVAYKKALQLAPRDIRTFSGLSAAYSLKGLDEEAVKMAAEVLKLDPNYTLEGRFKEFSPEKRNAMVTAFRKAGAK
jgi:tetratricopeptide (TPR) repeat protein